MDENDGMEKIEQPVSMSGGLGLESRRELKDSTENDFHVVQIHWEHIVMTTSRANKTTRGSLCQLRSFEIIALEDGCS